MAYQWTKEEEDIILNGYKNKIPFDDICKSLPHRTKAAIIARREFLGIKLFTPSTKNENFFSDVNPKSAWFAGWLATDGCVHYKGINSINVSIALQRRDEIVIREFKKITNSTANIYQKETINKNINGYIKDVYTSSISFTSAKKWADDLREIWSVVPRKTLILEPPKINDEDCIYSYIQGAIEGDGTINLSKSNKSIGYTIRISIVGTEKLLLWIKKYIDKLDLNNNNMEVNKRTDSVFIYSFYDNSVLAFWDKIKDLPTFKLNRKWDKVLFYKKLVELNSSVFPDKKTKYNILNEEYKKFEEEYNLKYNIKPKKPSTKFLDFSPVENISKEDFSLLFCSYLSKYSNFFIRHKKTNNPYLSLEMYGTEQFIHWINDKIKEFYGVTGNITMNNLSYRLNFEKKSVFLYKNIIFPNLQIMSDKFKKSEIIDFAIKYNFENPKIQYNN